jgi:phospholipid-transporting ATPase
MFWFGIWSAFSGQTFYEPWIYQMFNIVFTSVPIMFYSVFIFQYDKEKYLQEPSLYNIGIKDKYFGTVLFWKWILYGSF